MDLPPFKDPPTSHEVGRDTDWQRTKKLFAALIQGNPTLERQTETHIQPWALQMLFLSLHAHGGRVYSQSEDDRSGQGSASPPSSAEN